MATVADLDFDAGVLADEIASARSRGAPLGRLAKKFGLTIGAVLQLQDVANVRRHDRQAADREAKRLERQVAADLDAEPVIVDGDVQTGWLFLRRHGWSHQEIAHDAGVSVHTVIRAIASGQRSELSRPRAPDRVDPPHTRPMFPGTGFSPYSPCPHPAPIEQGSPYVCMTCHQSGHDHLPWMQWCLSDPRPDLKPRPVPLAKFTRSERRTIEFALTEAQARQAVPCQAGRQGTERTRVGSAVQARDFNLSNA